MDPRAEAERLRLLLHEPPSPQSWARLCALVAGPPRGPALDYLCGHMAQQRALWRQVAPWVPASWLEAAPGSAPGRLLEVLGRRGWPATLIGPQRFTMGWVERPDAVALEDWQQARGHTVDLEYTWCLQAAPVRGDLWARLMPELDHRGDPALPVVSVSWFQAVVFCNRLSRQQGLPPAYHISPEDPSVLPESVQWAGPSSPGWRLPTEPEWECACLAGGPRPSLEQVQRQAWHEETSGWEVQPCGLLEPNAWGLHDMLGNVWEWVQDPWSPYGQPPLSPDWSYLESPERPSVIRGGSFQDPADTLDPRRRERVDAQLTYEGVGLRCARTLSDTILLP